MSRRPPAPPPGTRDLAEVAAVYHTEAADAAAFHARTASAALAADIAANDEAIARCDTRAAWLAECVDGAPLVKKEKEDEAAAAFNPLAAALAAASAPASPPSHAAAASAARTSTFTAVMDTLRTAQTPEDLSAADAAFDVLRGGDGSGKETLWGGPGAGVRGPAIAPGLWPVTLPGGAPPPPPPGKGAEL